MAGSAARQCQTTGCRARRAAAAEGHLDLDEAGRTREGRFGHDPVLTMALAARAPTLLIALIRPGVVACLGMPEDLEFAGFDAA
jgi:hypothetical protein